MANRVEWMIAFFALLAVGAVPVMVNSRGAGPELQRAVEMTDCVAAICDGARYALLSGTGDLPVPVVLLGEAAAARLAGALDFDAASAPRDGLTLAFAPRDPEDPALIMFSSGTTGHPKAIVHPIVSPGPASSLSLVAGATWLHALAAQGGGE